MGTARAIRSGELGFEPGPVLPEFGAALVEVADEVLVGVLHQFQVAGQPPAAVVGVGDGPAQRGDALGVLVGGGVGLVAQVGGEQGAPVLAEDVLGEELVQGAQQGVLADPGAGWVAGGPVALLRGAAVVGGAAAAGAAGHAPAAQVAEQVGTQRVDAAGPGVAAGARVGAGPEPVGGDLLGLDEGFQVDELLVGGFGRPYPVGDGVGSVAAGPAGGAVPDHVPGVFGVWSGPRGR